MRVTWLWGRSSMLPVFSALGNSVYSVLHLAPLLQPWKQKPSCMQRPRSCRGWLLIATKLGYKEVHTGNMAINSQPRDDRGRCMQLGFCFPG